MSEGYVGRLAPSPTGLLHVGHAATFLRAAERARGGVLRLRSDDLDRARVRAEFVAAMVTDLLWLGAAWTGPVVVQTERLGLYRAAMERLLERGMVYACRCSRRELAGMVSAPHEETDEPVYPGRCRVQGAARQLVEGVNYRYRVPDGERVEFVDGGFGPQSFRCGCDAEADFGDFLVWRRDGLPSYQLATVVDDTSMGVTEVVRGRDLLRSTARQMLLWRALGWAIPQFLHTELRVDGAGMRLAKRHDARSIRALRESGMVTEEVRRMAMEGN